MPLYEEHNQCTYKINDEGERLLLSNFTARIVEEIRTTDGITFDTSLKITGTLANRSSPNRPTVLPEIEVAATNYAGMAWVMQQWGVSAVIQPGAGVKEDLRTAIQLASAPKITTIYRSLGWTRINGKRAYLHTKGAITEKGNDPSVMVRLPAELSKYDLSAEGKPKAAFEALMEVGAVAPEPVTWTLLAATFAPLYGPVDFAVHLTGRSGTFKSELTSLYQSCYGAEMDARHLPGSWSSTGNALEAQAYYAANAPLVVDDFVPVGTAWQVRQYQVTADKIIRAQGNQAGRARLTDTSGLQTTFYPRGLILSTGEDTPEGHSVRARMMIVELSPGDVDTAALTAAQKKRKLLPVVTAHLIRDLCAADPEIQDRCDEIRNSHVGTGHTRTPPMLARLIVTIEMLFEWAVGRKLIDADAAKRYVARAKQTLQLTAEKQCYYLETTDPVDVFLAGLRQTLGSGHGHIRSLNGGIPLKAPLLGWTEERGHSELPTYKSHGPCLGWVDWDRDELYLDVNTGYTSVKKMLGSEITLTKQTLFKRFKDAGLLTRTDDARQRNTVRITAEGHSRQVIALQGSNVCDGEQEESEPTSVPWN